MLFRERRDAKPGGGGMSLTRRVPDVAIPREMALLLSSPSASDVGAPELTSPTPVVSLVVIAYNEEANIRQCLESIFQQDGLASFEVIFVDDASTDGTLEIVDSLAREHPELRTVRHTTNRGRGAARRSGQDACRADLIGFIDSDIRLPANWLAKATEALEDADVVSGVAVPDGDVAVVWRIFKPSPKGMVGYWSLTGNNVLFRRRALEEVGWPAETRLTEDNRMAVALEKAGFRVVTIHDLRVEHHEGKSFRGAIAYSRETGFNATEILRDLRIFRFPDLVWTCWAAALLALVILSATGTIEWWQSLFIVFALTLAIDLGAMVQRFYFWRHPVRWIGAASANLVLIATYLGSRTFYSPRLLLRPRHATH